MNLNILLFIAFFISVGACWFLGLNWIWGKSDLIFTMKLFWSFFSVIGLTICVKLIPDLFDLD